MAQQSQVLALKAKAFDLITALDASEGYIRQLESVLSTIGKELNVKRLGRSPDTRLDLEGIVKAVNQLKADATKDDPLTDE